MKSPHDIEEVDLIWTRDMKVLYTLMYVYVFFTEYCETLFISRWVYREIPYGSVMSQKANFYVKKTQIGKYFVYYNVFSNINCSLQWYVAYIYVGLIQCMYASSVRFYLEKRACYDFY